MSKKIDVPARSLIVAPLESASRLRGGPAWLRAR
jgi:hypothetical protein